MHKDTDITPAGSGNSLLALLNKQANQHTAPAQPQSANRFPIEAFPRDIQRVITAHDECLNYPPDYTGTSILVAASVSIGNTAAAQPKAGWQESAVLFAALVGNPGTSKSHPPTMALMVHSDRDTAAYVEYEKAQERYDQVMKMSKTERENAGITEEPPKPIYKKSIIGDITPEALAQVHKNNPRGLCLHVDELAGWFKNFNRYSKGSEEQLWLSIFSSKPINSDRKTGPSIRVDRPFVSVIGTIQPSVLDEMAADGRGQNGFIDRILFAMPAESKAQYWSDKEIDPAIPHIWHSIAAKLLDMPLHVDEYNKVQPAILHFTPAAKAILFEWQRAGTDEVNRLEDAAASGLFAKMQTYAVRLSLILQMLRWATGEDGQEAIGEDAVKGALQLVAYYQRTAERVQGIVSKTDPLANLTEQKRRVYSLLPEVFTAKEGAEIAEGANMDRRTFERMLTHASLFKKLTRGEYQKQVA